MDVALVSLAIERVRKRELARLEASKEYDVYTIRKISREVDAAVRNVAQALMLLAEADNSDRNWNLGSGSV
jgi:hypothetical protein